ncbi:MAG: hypothetical protein ABEH65_08120 [Halobacteriales archaeon]
MTNRVFHLHSTLELPLADLREFLDDADLPDGIVDIEFTQRNNTLIIRAIPEDGSISKYTPTAQIKGTATTARVPDEAADPIPPSEQDELVWSDEPEQPMKTIDMAAFKGHHETILQNTALQFPMFQFLCALARQADGVLTAIIAEDGVLESIRIVDGEEQPTTIEVVEEPDDSAEDSGVDWQNNEYIN